MGSVHKQLFSSHLEANIFRNRVVPCLSNHLNSGSAKIDTRSRRGLCTVHKPIKTLQKSFKSVIPVAAVENLLTSRQMRRFRPRQFLEHHYQYILSQANN